FIQNADDAGATEIRFILDHHTYASALLEDQNLARLNGPSLLLFNNASFTPEDLENIQRLGDTQKAEAPAKIGRVVPGFKCCDNDTAYPQLLTGNSLYLCDPHKAAVICEPDTKPGAAWDLTPDLWRSSGGLLQPFLTAGLAQGSVEFQGTVFRLPLRTRDHIR